MDIETDGKITDFVLLRSGFIVDGTRRKLLRLVTKEEYPVFREKFELLNDSRKKLFLKWYVMWRASTQRLYVNFYYKNRSELFEAFKLLFRTTVETEMLDKSGRKRIVQESSKVYHLLSILYDVRALGSLSAEMGTQDMAYVLAHPLKDIKKAMDDEALQKVVLRYYKKEDKKF